LARRDMKALLVYVQSSGVGTGAVAPTADMSPRTTLDTIVSEGACGLCAYVEERDTPLEQFFRGLKSVREGEKDTTSPVMRLGEARCAVVLGGDVDKIDRETLRGVAIGGANAAHIKDTHIKDTHSKDSNTGSHEIYMERRWEDVSQRVSELLSSCPLSSSRLSSSSSSSCSSDLSPDVVYVVLAGDLAALERVVSGIDASVLDASFLTVVVERPGYDIHNIQQIIDDGMGDASSAVFRPPQSFTFRGSRTVPIRNDIVSTVVYRGPRSPPAQSNARTRVDGLASLDDVSKVYAEGCCKCVLAERVLFEVAYKVGWSDKYGS
jgi:hypothetical protein